MKRGRNKARQARKKNGLSRTDHKSRCSTCVIEEFRDALWHPPSKGGLLSSFRIPEERFPRVPPSRFGQSRRSCDQQTLRSTPDARDPRGETVNTQRQTRGNISISRPASLPAFLPARPPACVLARFDCVLSAPRSTINLHRAGCPGLPPTTLGFLSNSFASLHRQD